METILEVRTSGGAGYPVLSGRDAGPALRRLWDARWRQAVIIGDSTTARLFAPPIVPELARVAESVEVLQFPAGERNKSRTTKARLEDAMLALGIERSCCIVALGGGVTLDLAGFVAATYMRGVPHINVATTLLAQVDAAIGGKTGVNTRLGKNLIGAFHQPRAVLLDTGALGSLPPEEMRSGLAEAVKHAVLSDADLFAELEAWARRSYRLGSHKPPALPEDLLIRCVRVKAEVISMDEREAGRRQILNFGHTIAHAIERATRHKVGHGAAVAAGMVVEARIAERACGFPPEERALLESLLETVGLPTRPQCRYAQAEPFLAQDKKTLAGLPHFALPSRIGRIDEVDGRWSKPVPRDLVESAWMGASG